MNYIIDFDHTLYNTPQLAKDMLTALAKYISKSSQLNYDEILNTLSSKFSRSNDGIYDIYDLIAYFSKKYKFDEKEATDVVNNVISNGEKYLFEDSIPFLQYLKKQGHKIYILSYNESRVYFQTVKIAGSGLLKYVDGLTTTTTLKGDMPLDFSNCIFIDDKPKDLVSIYKKKPSGIYRIRRENDTYSEIDMDIKVPEFTNLTKLQKKLENLKNIDER